mmetsp:Transcript_29222/g.113394  ORF Transcript_29222/g.113394 Transcript_29222/m.113394 type:complete len:182 (+) Transcript_29222:528-1073(+)
MIVVDRVPIIERLEPDRYVRIRNYVAGPILEEIVFRGVCCTICMCAFPESNLHAYSTPAMLFSISHAHHAIRLIRTTNYARRDILATTLANVLVTGIFGLYAGMIFTKLGGIVSAITVHVICNCMSLPDVEGKLPTFPLVFPEPLKIDFQVLTQVPRQPPMVNAMKLSYVTDTKSPSSCYS